MSERYLIDDPLDPRDTGDVTHLRYMYQARLTAALALRLVLPDTNWKAILSEHHEDINILRTDEKRVAVQVKTKDRHLKAFYRTDKGIEKSFRNFRSHERQYGDLYVAYNIVTNHGFHPRNEGETSIEHWMHIAQSESDLHKLHKFEEATRPRESAALSSKELRDECRRVLRKTRLLPIGPHLEYAHLWLVSQVRFAVSVSDWLNKVNVEQAALDLTVLASAAMEFRGTDGESLTHYFGDEAVARVKRRTVIKNKTIQAHDVETVLENSGKRDWENPPSIIVRHQAYSPLPDIRRDLASHFSETTVWSYPIDLCSSKLSGEGARLAEALAIQCERLEAVRQRKKDRPHSTIHYHGVAPIPFVFSAGASFESSEHVVLYELSDRQKWIPLNDDAEDFEFSELEASSVELGRLMTSKEVVVVLSVSARITAKQFEGWVDSGAPVISISLKNPLPANRWIRSLSSVERVRKAFEGVLDGLGGDRAPELERIHLFMAAPVSVTFACGLALNLRALPEVVVYHFSRSAPHNYPWGIRIRESETEVVWSRLHQIHLSKR